MMEGVMKKNNKGFSLVELIVVVLIMAIIAVALAPQVMKWVENSRISSDLQTSATIENTCILALTEESAFNCVKDGGYEIVITKDKDSGEVSHAYKVKPSGGTPVLLHNGDQELEDDPFWQNFIKVGNFESFDAFEDATTIKSTPKNGSDIVIDVHVYEGGYTFSDLEGVIADDLGVS